MNLVFGILHGENSINPHYFRSIVHLLQARPDYLSEVAIIQSGPALTLGRGAMAQQFLDETEGDALLMVDADQVFTPATIAEHVNVWDLANQNEQVVANGGCHVLSGLAYCSPRTADQLKMTYRPSLYGDTPDNSGHHFLIEDPPDDTFCEVGASGAGCLMVSREVLTAIRAEYGDRWFHHVPLIQWVLLARDVARCDDATKIEEMLRGAVLSADELGEDISFCRRARNLGFHIYAHTGLFYDHAKTILMGRPQPKEKADA